MDSLQRSGIDRIAAKKYFKGAGLIPYLLIVIGFPLLVILPVGLISILAGLVWIIAVKLAAAAYERDVDKIIVQEQKYLLNRGMNKLNIIEQQANLIDPISVIGTSYQPELISDGKLGFFKKLEKSATKAPVFIQKIGNDGKCRSSLIEITIFIFGETELYIYFAHLDLTTGLIFHEGTHEYFYKDICGITTDQILRSLYNPKKRKFEYRLFEFIHIFTYGCNHKSAFDSSISRAALDEQFTAMRNLIRDKKDEKQGSYAAY